MKERKIFLRIELEFGFQSRFLLTSLNIPPTPMDADELQKFVPETSSESSLTHFYLPVSRNNQSSPRNECRQS